jgi:hypothetical protein
MNSSVIFCPEISPERDTLFSLLGKKVTLTVITAQGNVPENANDYTAILQSKLTPTALEPLLTKDTQVIIWNDITVAHALKPFWPVINTKTEYKQRALWYEEVELPSRIHRVQHFLLTWKLAFQTKQLLITTVAGEKQLRNYYIPFGNQTKKQLIPTYYTNEQITAFAKNNTTTRKETLTIALFIDSARKEEIANFTTAIKLFPQSDTRFVLFGDRKLTELEQKLIIDSRITVKAIKDEPPIDCYITTNSSQLSQKTIHKLLASGTPVVLTDKNPSAAILSADFPKIVLHDTDPINITKAMYDLHQVWKKPVSWQKLQKSLSKKMLEYTHEVVVDRVVGES